MAERQQFVIEKDKPIPRNPLAVLNLDPTYRAPGQRTFFIAELPAEIRKQQGKMPPPTGCAIREDVAEKMGTAFQSRAEEWAKCLDAETGRPAEDQLTTRQDMLRFYLKDMALYASARADEREWTETLFCTLGRLSEGLHALPERDRAGMPATPMIRPVDAPAETRAIPSLADIEEFHAAMSQWLAALRVRVSRRKRREQTLGILDQAVAVLDQVADQTQRLRYFDEYCARLWPHVEMQDAYLSFDECIRERANTLRRHYHPDRKSEKVAVAQRRSQEIEEALKTLLASDDMERIRMAESLVFGDASTWTDDIRTALREVVLMYAPIQARQAQPTGDVPCTSCRGLGGIMRSSARDVIAVSMLCETCDGSGFVDSTIHDLRERLATIARPKT